MARTNGGITGKRNVASFGKCKVTVKTSSGNLCTQPGTRLVKALIVAGGGGGGRGTCWWRRSWWFKKYRNICMWKYSCASYYWCWRRWRKCPPANRSRKGSDSNIIGNNGTFESEGGGCGGNDPANVSSGGSGGGAAYGSRRNYCWRSW